MSQPFAHFFRFLGSVRRRLLVVRLTERVGLAILIACAPALLAAALLMWRGRPALTIVELLIASGFIAGVAWAVLRRPTLLAAALEADRQMKLAELLSSAWLCWRAESCRRDGWAAALLVEADARCAELLPASLRLRRLGGRTWGAVGLAVGLVITLALLGPSSQSFGPNGAHDPAKRDLALGTNLTDDGQKPGIFASPENRPILLADPDDLNASHFGQDGSPQAAAQAAKAAASPGDSAKSDAHASTSSDSPGNGPGSARTTPNPDAAKPQLATGHAAGSPSASDKTADSANGAGNTSQDAVKNGTDATGGALAGAGPQSASLPPWKAADWPATIQRARIALSAGDIPPAYRDLVREYFSTSSQ